MTDKVIYDDDGTRAELDTDLDVIVLTSQPFWKKENTLLLTVKEIDAIHAAIHADDEPEPVEADCCGNCRACVTIADWKDDTRKIIRCHGGTPAAGVLFEDRWAPVSPDDWCYQHRRKE